MERRLHLLLAITAVTAVALNVGTLPAAQPGPAKYARPPEWPADVRDAFFADAREQLVGTRPSRPVDPATEVLVVTSAGPPDEAAGSTARQWSRIIDARTIETEIKRLAQAIAADVNSPGVFKGGGYKSCRKNFSLLAVLFAVGAQYDGPVRWQDVAAGLRDQFARAGLNCKVGTDQTYREAESRKLDLTELINGSRPQVPAADGAIESWSDVADRPPLMQRLNQAHEERLTKWLANEREFKRHVDEVRHEAQLVALIADVIAREHFDYWDDETYSGYANDLKQSATEIATAAENDDFPQAQQAAARATQACSNCHDGYRG